MYKIVKFFDREILPLECGNYKIAQEAADYLNKTEGEIFAVLKIKDKEEQVVTALPMSKGIRLR